MSEPNFRRPREKNPHHLRFIHGLPCLICGRPGEAAHIRYGLPSLGKRPTGAGEKPSDKYTVPLCVEHHREGPDAQHNHGEKEWWMDHHIDPITTSALLWQVTGDHAAAVAIIGYTQRLAMMSATSDVVEKPLGAPQ